jgi:hypothetical protein
MKQSLIQFYSVLLILFFVSANLFAEETGIIESTARIFRFDLYSGSLLGTGIYEHSVTDPNKTNSKDVIHNLETDNFNNYRKKNVPSDLRSYNINLVAGVKLGLGSSGKYIPKVNDLDKFYFPDHFRYYFIGLGFESEVEYKYYGDFSAYSYKFSGMYTFLFPLWFKVSLGKEYTDKPLEYARYYDISVQNKTRTAVLTDSRYFDTFEVHAVFFFDLSEQFSLYFQGGSSRLNRNKMDEKYDGSSFNLGVIYHFINI